MPENFTLKPILMLFVVVLIGVVFLGEIADNQIENTELSSKTNESIAITATTNTITNETITMASQTGTTGNHSVTSVTFFGNMTNSTHLLWVNVTPDVNFTKDGNIIVSSIYFPADGSYNISYTYTTDATGTTAEDDVTSVSFFGNMTNSTHSSSTSVNTHVNFTEAGVITVDTFRFDAGTYNISYSYEGELYVVDTTTHPLLKLLAIFFVLVIFAFAISAMRDSSGNFKFGFK